MKTSSPINIMVCSDCIQYLANGPDDVRQAYEDLHEGLGDIRIQTIEDCISQQRDAGFEALVGDSGEFGEHVDPFSRYQCELCHTALGGSRHPAVLMPLN